MRTGVCLCACVCLWCTGWKNGFMDRKYSTLDLPKRTEPMQGIIDLTKASQFKFLNTNIDHRESYTCLISFTNVLLKAGPFDWNASVPAFCGSFASYAWCWHGLKELELMCGFRCKATHQHPHHTKRVSLPSHRVKIWHLTSRGVKFPQAAEFAQGLAWPTPEHATDTSVWDSAKWSLHCEQFSATSNFSI